MSKKKVELKIDLKYNISTLNSFLKNYRFLVLFIIILTLLVELVVLSDSFIFKYLVDKATLYSQEQLTSVLFFKVILLSVIVYFILKLLGSVIWYLILQSINHLEAALMNDIENQSFWHVLNLSYRFHLGKKTGSIISQFTRGVGKIESLVDSFVFSFIPVFFRFVLSIAVIFYFDFYTSLALLIMALTFIVSGIYMTNRQKIPQDQANDDEDFLKHNLSDIFLNIETVKYFAKEKRTYSFFSFLSQKLKNSRERYWKIFSQLVAVQNAILALGLAAIFYISFTQFLKGSLTLGAITLIYSAVWKLIPQLDNFMHGYRQFIRSLVDINSLFVLFKEKNEVVDIVNAKPLQVENGHVEFQHIYFTYPQRENVRTKQREAVLKDINIKILPNSKTALVGLSGGGKTTIIKLLYRLFDLDSGKIKIDNQDISKIAQQSLRENMSIVPQEPILFDNTLYYNIAYANPSASKEEVWKAIRFAHLDKFIKKLPRKERTLIGERGVRLSGGEKQRVSIARALLANKKILILDEATSALDSQTEKEIQRDLFELMKNRTSIIIAHRLSTIITADNIIVLKNGQIVEQGQHHDLIKLNNGLYRRMWELQQGRKL